MKHSCVLWYQLYRWLWSHDCMGSPTSEISWSNTDLGWNVKWLEKECLELAHKTTLERESWASYAANQLNALYQFVTEEYEDCDKCGHLFASALKNQWLLSCVPFIVHPQRAKLKKLTMLLGPFTPFFTTSRFHPQSAFLKIDTTKKRSLYHLIQFA